jgi:hypothetical protein
MSFVFSGALELDQVLLCSPSFPQLARNDVKMILLLAFLSMLTTSSLNFSLVS